MKIKIITATLALVIFSSCEKILDEQIPKHSNVEFNTITDQKTAETALVGVYSYLASASYQWEWHYCLDFGHLAGTTRGSGSATSGGLEAGTEGELIFNTMRADNSMYLSKWQNAYKMINASNWTLQLIEGVDDSKFSGNRKKGIIAEARFLRFFAGFYLFRHFAQFWNVNSSFGLLYRDEPASALNHVKARLNVAESYTVLLEDLDYCIANGPETADVYHASKLVAKAFKAKLLAMRGTGQDWKEIIKLTDEVIASGSFALETDHYSIFKKRNKSKEVIFSRYFSPNLVASNLGTARSRFNLYYRSTDWVKNLSTPQTQYYKAINDTIVSYTASTNVTTNNYQAMGKIASYGLTEAELVANSATLYIRLAEMVILKAEAIARTGGDAATVCNILNPLLVRAKDVALNPSELTSKEYLLDAVYRTLIKELVAESGIDFEASFRFMDITKGLPYIIAQKENLKTIDNLKLCILPIPVNELTINTLCVQNDGY